MCKSSCTLSGMQHSSPLSLSNLRPHVCEVLGTITFTTCPSVPHKTSKDLLVRSGAATACCQEDVAPIAREGQNRKGHIIGAAC